MDIEWEDPPEHLKEAVHRGHYAAFADVLRQNPGRWAVLPGTSNRTEKGASGTAANIRRGVMADFKPKGAFDVRHADGKVWVKYVGEPSVAEAGGGKEPRETRDYDGFSASEIRHWARTNGFNVPERGRLPEEILTAFARAQEG